jgi:hypothetical protein
MEYFIPNKISYLPKNSRKLRELLAAAAGLEDTAQPARSPAAQSLRLGAALQRLGVAVVVEMLQKPPRKMADDPAASGP